MSSDCFHCLCPIFLLPLAGVLWYFWYFSDTSSLGVFHYDHPLSFMCLSVLTVLFKCLLYVKILSSPAPMPSVDFFLSSHLCFRVSQRWQRIVYMLLVIRHTTDCFVSAQHRLNASLYVPVVCCCWSIIVLFSACVLITSCLHSAGFLSMTVSSSVALFFLPLLVYTPWENRCSHSCAHCFFALMLCLSGIL